MSNSITASVKDIRMSSRKVGLVASLVRGRTVADAVVILDHTPKRAAKPLAKLMKSVEANAKNNHKLDPKSLKITSLEVNGGTMLKRYRPAAHGRALPYRHRMTSVKVVVEGEPQPVKKTPAKTTAKKEEAK